jgi:hypothetical protein
MSFDFLSWLLAFVINCGLLGKNMYTVGQPAREG